MVHETFLAPRVEEDQWTVLFIYLFIIFWAPSLSLQQLPVFVAADLPLGPLQQPHIFIAVPVFENLINKRTWLVTQMYGTSC